MWTSSCFTEIFSYNKFCMYESSIELVLKYSPKRDLVKYLVQYTEEDSMELTFNHMTGETIFQW